MKIKTGDTVVINTGKDSGKKGKIMQVFPNNQKVVVEGMNILKKHLKAKGKHQGQKIEFSAPIHVSNVTLVSTKTNIAGRVGYKIIDGKKKMRVLHKKGSTQDVE